MASRERRVDAPALILWVLIAFAICTLAAVRIGHVGTVWAMFIASLILRDRAFVREE